MKKQYFKRIKATGGVCNVSLILAFVLLMAFSLPGCQPTPEEQVVIQKDNFENLVNNTAVSLETEEGQQTSEAQQSEEAGSIPEGKRRITWENTVTNEVSGRRC